MLRKRIALLLAISMTLTSMPVNGISAFAAEESIVYEEEVSDAELLSEQTEDELVEDADILVDQIEDTDLFSEVDEVFELEDGSNFVIEEVSEDASEDVNISEEEILEEDDLSMEDVSEVFVSESEMPEITEAFDAQNDVTDITEEDSVNETIVINQVYAPPIGTGDTSQPIYFYVYWETPEYGTRSFKGQWRSDETPYVYSGDVFVQDSFFSTDEAGETNRIGNWKGIAQGSYYMHLLINGTWCTAPVTFQSFADMAREQGYSAIKMNDNVSFDANHTGYVCIPVEIEETGDYVINTTNEFSYSSLSLYNEEGGILGNEGVWYRQRYSNLTTGKYWLSFCLDETNASREIQFYSAKKMKEACFQTETISGSVLDIVNLLKRTAVTVTFEDNSVENVDKWSVESWGGRSYLQGYTSSGECLYISPKDRIEFNDYGTNFLNAGEYDMVLTTVPTDDWAGGVDWSDYWLDEFVVKVSDGIPAATVELTFDKESAFAEYNGYIGDRWYSFTAPKTGEYRFQFSIPFIYDRFYIYEAGQDGFTRLYDWMPDRVSFEEGKTYLVYYRAERDTEGSERFEVFLPVGGEINLDSLEDSYSLFKFVYALDDAQFNAKYGKYNIDFYNRYFGGDSYWLYGFVPEFGRVGVSLRLQEAGADQGTFIDVMPSMGYWSVTNSFKTGTYDLVAIMEPFGEVGRKTITLTAPETVELTEEEPVFLSGSMYGKAYSFVPSSDGKYVLSVNGYGEDSCLDEISATLVEKDGDTYRFVEWGYVNYLVSATLTKGKEYLIFLEGYGDPCDLEICQALEVKSVTFTEKPEAICGVAGLDKVRIPEGAAILTYENDKTQEVEFNSIDRFGNYVHLAFLPIDSDGNSMTDEDILWYWGDYSLTEPGQYELLLYVESDEEIVCREAIPAKMLSIQEAGEKNPFVDGSITLPGSCEKFSVASFQASEDGVLTIESDQPLRNFVVVEMVSMTGTDGDDEAEYIEESRLSVSRLDEYTNQIYQEKGHTYYVGFRSAEDYPEVTLTLSKPENPITEVAVSSSNSTVIAGLDRVKADDLSVVLSYEDGSTQKVTGNNKDTDGNGFRYLIQKQDADEEEEYELHRFGTTLDVGTYLINAVHRTFSAICSKSGAVISAEAIDVTQLPEVKANTDMNLRKTSTRSLYQFTPTEPGKYELTNDMGVQWQFYSVDETSGLIKARRLTAGETYVLCISSVMQDATVRIQVSNRKKAESGDEVDLSVGDTREVDIIDHEPIEMSFVPTEDGSYTIWSTGNTDSLVRLYLDGNQLDYNDDYINTNFNLTHDLQAGNKYVYEVNTFSGSGEFTVHFDKGKEITALSLHKDDIPPTVCEIEQVNYDTILVDVTYSDGTSETVDLWDLRDNRRNEIGIRYVPEDKPNTWLPDTRLYPGTFTLCVCCDEIKDGAKIQVLSVEECAIPYENGSGEVEIETCPDTWKILSYVPANDETIEVISDTKLSSVRFYQNSELLSEDRSVFRGIQEVEAGKTYCIAIKTKEPDTIRIRIDAIKAIDTDSITLKSLKDKLIAGLDYLTPEDMQVSWSYTDGTSVKVRGNERDAQGNGFCYQIVKEDTDEEVYPYDTLSAGDYLIRAIHRTMSAIASNNIRVTANTLDFSELEVLEENTEYELPLSKGRKLYGFEPKETGYYFISSDSNDYSEVYEVTPSGLEYAGSGYTETYMTAGQKYVLVYNHIWYDKAIKIIKLNENGDDPEEKPNTIPLELGKTVDLMTNSGLEKVYSFTPQEKGKYTISGITSYIAGEFWLLCEELGTEINFRGDETLTLKAGYTYYIIPKVYEVFDQEEAEATLLIRKTPIVMGLDVSLYPEVKLYRDSDYISQDIFQRTIYYSDGTSEVLERTEYDSYDNRLNMYYELDRSDNGYVYNFDFQIRGISKTLTIPAWNGEEPTTPINLNEYTEFTATKKGYQLVSVDIPEAGTYLVFTSHDEDGKPVELLNSEVNLNVGTESTLRVWDSVLEGDKYKVKVLKRPNVEKIEILDHSKVYNQYFENEWNYSAKVTYDNKDTEIVRSGCDTTKYGHSISVSTNTLSEGIRRINVKIGNKKTSFDLSELTQDNLPSIFMNNTVAIDLNPELDGETYIAYQFTPEVEDEYTFKVSAEGNVWSGHLFDAESGDKIGSSQMLLEKGKTYIYILISDEEVHAELEVTNENHVHVWDEGIVTTEPGCTTTGVKLYTCVNCGEVKTEELPIAGHTYAIDEAVEPTCTTLGMEEGSHCSVCGEIQIAQKTIPALGHNWGNVQTVAPTCTEDGHQTWTCDRCEDGQKTVVLSALGHTEVIDEAVPATCEEDGLTEGSHCAVCDTVIKEQEIVSSQGGHTWNDGAVTKNPDCVNKGEMTYTCTVCSETKTEEIEATNHTFGEYVSDNNATCTEDGTETATCEVCEKTNTRIATDSKKEHSFGEWSVKTKGNCQSAEVLERVCADCGYAEHKIGNTGDHSYTEEESNVIDGGATRYTKACTICGKEEVRTVLSEAQMTQITEAQALVDDGEVTLSEKLAAVTDLDNQMLADSDNHSIVEELENELMNNQKEDEIKIGETSYDSAESGITIESVTGAGVTVAKAMNDAEEQVEEGETYSAKVEVRKQEAEPEDDGKKRYQVDISLYIVDSNDEKISEEPQQLLAPVKITMSVPEEYQNTIFELIHVNETNEREKLRYTLSSDGTSITFTAAGLSPHILEPVTCIEHTAKDGSETKFREASCKIPGEKHAKCEMCGKEYVSATIDVTAHDFVEVPSAEETLAATCTTAGKIIKKCNACGKIQTVVAPATGHEFSEYVSDGNATCKADGTKTRRCVKECGAVETVADEGSKLSEHSPEPISKVDATCTTDGSENGIRCSVCEMIIHAPEPIKASGHTWDNGEVKTPVTCTEAGKMLYTCTNEGCGETKEIEIPSQGHNVVIDKGEAPACAKIGYEDGQHCTECSEVTIARKEIPALEHAWSDEITRKPTYTTPGNLHRTCTRCLVEVDQEIPTLSHHFAETFTVDKEATCLEAGSKSRHCTDEGCDEVTEITEIPALGHDSVTDLGVPASCTTDGKTAGSHCSRCGKIFAVQNVVKALGHEAAADPAVAATCTADGKTAGQHCSRCNTVLTPQTKVPMTGHKYGDWVETVEPTVLADGVKQHICSACGAKENGTVPKLPATIKLNVTKLPIKVKQSAKVITVTMGKGDSIVSWSSNKPKIAKVDKKTGKITGVKAGKAIITVTLKSGKSAKVTVTVQKKAVTTTKLTVTAKKNVMKGKKLTLKKKAKDTLIVSKTPLTSTDKITFKTSNKKCVTVDKKGNIVAKAKGTAKITVKAGKKSTVITVTVK